MQPYDPNRPNQHYSVPESQHGRPRQGTWLPVLLAVLLVLILISLVRIQFDWGGQVLDPEARPRPVTPRGDLAADEQATIELFHQASPTVVNITSVALGRDFGFNILEVPRGTGSGVIWDERGYVVTNYHVVENASRFRVTLADQSSWDAVLVGAAPDKDLAVIKINNPSNRLSEILVGDSAELQVGQKVFAIGNPFGLDQTLTTGVISGLGRQIAVRSNRTIDGVIQTDAAINPGNSGGPLLDSAGRLIGVNTAIYSPTGASAGIGFAIPVDTVNRVVTQLIRHGQIIRPGLGVHIAPESWSRRLELDGILVIDVMPGSPAAEAGVMPTRRDADGQVRLGDVIIAVDLQRVRTENELLSTLEQYEVGDTVTLTVKRHARSDQEHETELSVTLQALAE